MLVKIFLGKNAISGVQPKTLATVHDKDSLVTKELAMTQQDLADLSGISRVTLGKLERGEIAAVSIKTIDIALNALGYELDIKLKNNFGLDSL